MGVMEAYIGKYFVAHNQNKFITEDFLYKHLR